jgi:hypothetical protein
MTDLMTVEAIMRAVLPVLLSVSILAAGFSATSRLVIGPVPEGQAEASRPWVTLPKIAEHRYRIQGKIRLLLFWIGRDNVGSARMVWYRGAGTDRGYEFLIGSDPTRAPRGINRWGYVSEEHRGGVATTVGVMKASNEATLEEARRNVENAGTNGVVFSEIHETVAAGESVSEVTTTLFKHDYSYHDLDQLLAEFATVTRPPDIKRAHLDADVTPGLLTTIAAVMHEDAETRRKSPASRGALGRVARYVYNAKVYTLTLAASQFIGTQEYGGRKFPSLVRNEFEITMQGFSWKEKFTVVYSLESEEVEVPVFAVYQPRWWFKAELLLDDSQAM